MENHPIPQDITGFQFKLIGAMTVRQFVYLAIGAIIAFVVFFILPISTVIKLPVSIISISIGALFAFVPVGGRPMDTMVSNFLKALFAPTQYIYTKTGGDLSQAQNYADANTQKNAKNQASAPKTLPAPILSLEDEEPEQTKSSEGDLKVLLAKTQLQKEALQKELETLRAKMNPAEQAQPVQSIPPIQIQTQTEVQAPPPPVPAQVPAPVQPPPPVLIPIPDAQLIKAPIPKPPEAPTSTTMPIPEAPNLITGLLKDPRGNPLQNILVEVKDQDQNPVRAFKTNGLGQFASATSLSDGKYIISFEDPKEQNKFDSVQIEAVGAPIVPLEITSVDSREELRRQLFN